MVIESYNEAHSRVEIYDINQGFIEELPELPTPRYLINIDQIIYEYFQPDNKVKLHEGKI